MLHHVLDRFLGRHHLGSLAINQILPGGREQLTHTDYPPGFYTMKVTQRPVDIIAFKQVAST